MRVAICIGLVVASFVVGIYCIWIIGASYRAAGGGFSFRWLTWAFNGFEHPHKALIVGGWLGSIIVGLGALMWGGIMAGQYSLKVKADKAQKSPPQSEVRK